MSLINTRIIKIDLSGIEAQLERLNHNLEEIFQINKPQIRPEVDFDPDDYSSVLYHNEEQELIDEKLGKRIAGLDLGL